MISSDPNPAPTGLAAAPTVITYYASTGVGSTTIDGEALTGAPTAVGNYVAQMTWGGQTASVAFSIVKVYPISIGGTMVNSANLNDVFGDGKVRFTPANTTDNTSATLYLNGYSYSGEYGIDYQGTDELNTDELNIVLTGDNYITNNTGASGITAFKGGGKPCGLVFSGSGSLSASGKGSGIYANNNITINSGRITAEGATGIESTQGSITVNGGSVTATGTGEEGKGIKTKSSLIINADVTSVVAISSNGAINGTVKNAIAGKGWDTVEGTGDGTVIPINTEGQIIPSHKKVQFVSQLYHQHSFSYSASGATITATCDNTDRKCPLTDKKVTLTLSAADATYTSSAYTGASLSDTTEWTGAGLIAPTIEYEGRGDTSYTKSETAPTNVGTYTASITVDTNKTATVDFTISPKALTITGATATNVSGLPANCFPRRAKAGSGRPPRNCTPPAAI